MASDIYTHIYIYAYIYKEIRRGRKDRRERLHEAPVKVCVTVESRAPAWRPTTQSRWLESNSAADPGDSEALQGCRLQDMVGRWQS